MPHGEIIVCSCQFMYVYAGSMTGGIVRPNDDVICIFMSIHVGACSMLNSSQYMCVYAGSITGVIAGSSSTVV